ncbi:MAG: hypothetical protein PHY54_13780 [Methylococcales bacterium]|nr:hypothetical protein [Methylococcales bacterium]
MTDTRVEKVITECDKHLKRINSAYLKMSVFMPLDAKSYQHLSDDEIEHIDQFLFRFAKLQDAIGEKLFHLLLEFLKEENTRNKPFIDILNRLEQLGILEDKNVWLELRKTRNNIAHQYEDEPEQATEALNAIYVAKPILEKIYITLKASYCSRSL